ncbi:hypothetical protein F4780DRAFT_78990 [Xylariomycetidae sp. FL0641]|nr:hypothetical protein F4780DRAFT_78990 [Xylariomycetidae sp. FL0641]
MLSDSSSSGLRTKQISHRRQKSTPQGIDTTKTANNLQNMDQAEPEEPEEQRPRAMHRRGMSLDTRQHLMQPRVSPPRQGYTMVSNPTNTGLTRHPQHGLRETQQQSIARPGSQHAYPNLAPDEGYIPSPNREFHRQMFDSLMGAPDVNYNFDMYPGPRENYTTNVSLSPDFELFSPSTLSTTNFMDFPDSHSAAAGWISDGGTTSTRGSRRVSNGLSDRVARFENLGAEFQQRPLTPPSQNAPGYFPLTPMETPHDRTIRRGRRPQRFAEGFDESAEETLKPKRSSAHMRPRTNFDNFDNFSEMRQNPAQPTGPNGLPLLSRASTMPQPGPYNPPGLTSPDFMGLGQVNRNGLRLDTQFHGIPQPSPLSLASDFSQQVSPLTPALPDFSASFDYKHNLSPHLAGEVLLEDTSASTEKPSRRPSPLHRRHESMASMASDASAVSAASIASIDIEKTKTMTGVTMDDIQQYIQGPDPRDNKWVCKFENCNKKFGRKENIKSHVQTHLNDRQYQCPNCHKCFVRQHDLKRHAKIHTGIKPYPCKCGNSFARHDALTRHKQRGMCVGAFDGIVRKVVKRGRPRKHRPEMEERQEKATRTQKKNKSISSVSSQSGYSEDNSPVDKAEFDELMDVSMGGTTMNPSSLQCLGPGASSAPMPTLSAAEPAAGASSPDSVHSYISQLSQLSNMSLHVEAGDTSHPGSPAKSVVSSHSQYNELPELPELSQSASPLFEVSAGAGDPPHSSSSSVGLESMIGSACEDTAGLPSFSDDGEPMIPFHHRVEPNVLLMSDDTKLDAEGYDNDNLFSDDDLFFGAA